MIITKKNIPIKIGVGILRRKLRENLEKTFFKESSIDLKKKVRKELIKDLKMGKLKVHAWN